MQTFLFRTVIIGLAFCAVLSPTRADDWEIYTSEELNVQFEIPPTWEVDNDGETLVAAPPRGGISFVIASYEDGSISTEDLFVTFADSLEFEVSGEYEEIEDFNGFHAMLGNGVAMIDGEPVVMLMIALTMDEANHVAYVFCNPDLADKYGQMMQDLLLSIRPLQG